jgi:ElaB/YqjD/DUF883 family membrane-anchored ribosome-binding protein
MTEPPDAPGSGPQSPPQADRKERTPLWQGMATGGGIALLVGSLLGFVLGHVGPQPDRSELRQQLEQVMQQRRDEARRAADKYQPTQNAAATLYLEVIQRAQTEQYRLTGGYSDDLEVLATAYPALDPSPRVPGWQTLRVVVSKDRQAYSAAVSLNSEMRFGVSRRKERSSRRRCAGPPTAIERADTTWARCRRLA